MMLSYHNSQSVSILLRRNYASVGKKVHLFRQKHRNIAYTHTRWNSQPERASKVCQLKQSRNHFSTQSLSPTSNVTSLPDIQIVEVSPRDGLQNEPIQNLTTKDKIELIQKLANSGCSSIEMGSFVSPKWVPAMADSDIVVEAWNDYYFQSAGPKRNVQSSVLVPNLRGLERALAIRGGVHEVAIAASASDAFAQKNWNCQTSEELISTKCQPVADALRQHNNDTQQQGGQENQSNVNLRGYVSCVVACPYQGPVTPLAVAKVVERLLELQCTQISLGDTIGVATPASTRAMLDEVQAVIRGHPRETDLLAAHYHDTYGQALANLLVSVERGITTIDSSVAGLGGCPYAKGASGNVATEDVIYMLHGMGLSTGIEPDDLVATGDWICQRLKRPNGSKVALAMLAKEV